MPDFASLQIACYTQFRMIVGEFNLPSGKNSGTIASIAVYYIIYFLMVFSLLLNFFLAIVIDSYSNVKEAVKGCKVESNVLWDLFATIAYPVVATYRGWPSRVTLVHRLMRKDMDEDGINDEEEEEFVEAPVTAELLEKFGILSIKAAESLMQHYHYMCPSLLISWEEKFAELEHIKWYKELKVLDRIRSTLHSDQVKSSNDEADQHWVIPVSKLSQFCDSDSDQGKDTSTDIIEMRASLEAQLKEIRQIVAHGEGARQRPALERADSGEAKWFGPCCVGR